MGCKLAGVLWVSQSYKQGPQTFCVTVERGPVVPYTHSECTQTGAPNREKSSRHAYLSDPGLSSIPRTKRLFISWDLLVGSDSFTDRRTGCSAAVGDETENS